MRINDLGKILADEYAKANDKALAVHLFGIRHADGLGNATNKVVEAAGLSKSWGTEVRKGIKLAKFVTLKN